MISSSHPKETAVTLCILWLAGVVRWYSFLSTTLLYVFFAGGIAGVAEWSQNLNERNPDGKPQHNRSGVSFSIVSLELVGSTKLAGRTLPLLSVFFRDLDVEAPSLIAPIVEYLIRDPGFDCALVGGRTCESCLVCVWPRR